MKETGERVKRLLIQVLAVFGLAPARSCRAAMAQVRESEAKVKRLGEVIEELKESTQGWKAKAARALERNKVLDAEAKRQSKLTATTEKTLTQRVESLQKRLIEAERELALTREQLMVMDVKLDVLEGAANVLDLRTRTALANQPGQSGVSV